MTNKRIVLTTAGSVDEAQKLARALVERRLAACVNIVGPIESFYWWKGEMETAKEWLLLVKTTADTFDAVESAIRELHSYELPECIQLPIERGSEQYLTWIAQSVSRSK